MKKLLLLIAVVLLLPGCAWKFSAEGIDTPTVKIDKVETEGEVKPEIKEETP